MHRCFIRIGTREFDGRHCRVDICSRENKQHRQSSRDSHNSDQFSRRPVFHVGTVATFHCWRIAFAMKLWLRIWSRAVPELSDSYRIRKRRAKASTPRATPRNITVTPPSGTALVPPRKSVHPVRAPPPAKKGILINPLRLPTYQTSEP